jgi:hypothetical protein
MSLKDVKYSHENQCFVGILSPILEECILRELLAPSVPRSKEEMDTYHQFMDVIREFDLKMKCEGGILSRLRLHFIEFKILVPGLIQDNSCHTRFLCNSSPSIYSQTKSEYSFYSQVYSGM